jgi:hypothetical protein
MTVLNEIHHAGCFIVSEEENNYSRDQITLLTGHGVLQPGTVLGQITASNKYIPALAGAVDGSQTAKAILYGYADTTSADVIATAITRLAQVRASDLTVDSSLTATYAAQLAAVDGPIIVR